MSQPDSENEQEQPEQEKPPEDAHPEELERRVLAKEEKKASNGAYSGVPR
jgi:hypothetical protein